MPKMIACCGLVCTECPTFIATQDDDDEARAKTAVFYKNIWIRFQAGRDQLRRMSVYRRATDWLLPYV